MIPETRRRRASTTEKSERILKMSRSLTLTRSVLAGTLAEATPNQLDFIERWFTAELDSREQSTPAPAQTGRLPRRQDPRRL